VEIFTRGNGNVGRNVTEFLKYLNIKKKLKIKCEFFIRGELVISKELY
jgi:NAD-dependent DNA ligase